MAREEVHGSVADRIGTSQWLLDDRRNDVQFLRRVPVAGAGVRGSSGAARRACPSSGTAERADAVRSIGYLRINGHPELPGKKPKPKASLRSHRRPPSLSRSNPDGTPVFDGAMKRCG